MLFEKSEMEGNVEETSREMEELKNEKEGLESNLSKIADSINNLKEDVFIQKSLETNVENSQQKLELVQERKELVSEKIKGMVSSLKEIKEKDKESLNELNALESIGEDVSDGKDILDAREAWVDACLSKLYELDEELGIEFDNAIEKLGAGADKENSFEQRRKEFKDRIKFESNKNPQKNESQSDDDDDPNKGQRERDVTKRDTEMELGSDTLDQATVDNSKSENEMQMGEGFAQNAIPPYGLLNTQQEITSMVLENGKTASVFDHPFEANSKRICNQGSAYPTGPMETCGCCSSGTIINKAGGNTNERDIVALALKKGFCDKDGYTSANTIAGLLSESGVKSSVTSGTKLDTLADYVEQGHGVIIAVNARRFDPRSYRKAGGHAIVLESVIRDQKTKEILEYVVIDSNGRDSVSAVKRISPRRLNRAFRDFGSQSITTNYIIW